MTVGQLLVSVGADITNLDKNLDAAIRKSKDTAAGFTALGRTITTALTVPIGLMGAGVLTAAVQFDSLRRGLMAFAGTAEETERQLTDLREVAKLPGLGFKEAIQGSIRLQAVGLDADFAARALKAFGNAVALTGGGKGELDRVTIQLGQMAAKSKVLTQDLRPIIEAAPAVAKALKDAFGTVNPEEINKLHLSTKQFMTQLLTSLEKLPQMTGGARNSMENFQDSLFRASATIGNQLLPTITPLIERTTAFLNQLEKTNPETLRFSIVLLAVTAAIGPLILIIAGLIKLFAGFAGLVAGVTAAWGYLGAALSLAAGEAATATGAIAALRLGVNAFFAVVGPAALAIAALTAVIFAGIAVWKNWNILVYEFRQTFPNVARDLEDVWGSFQRFGSVVGDTFSDVVDWFVEVEKTMRVWQEVLHREFGIVLSVAVQTLQEIVSWIDRLDRAITKVTQPVKDALVKMEGYFYNLWNSVVGHSYVPDMIAGIQASFAKLHSAMVVPTQQANNAVLTSFANTAAALTPQQERLIALMERHESVAKRLKDIRLDIEFERDAEQLTKMNAKLAETQTEFNALTGKIAGLRGVRLEMEGMAKAAELLAEAAQKLDSFDFGTIVGAPEPASPVPATDPFTGALKPEALAAMAAAFEKITPVVNETALGLTGMQRALYTLEGFTESAGQALLSAGKGFLKSVGNMGLKLLNMFNPLTIVASALDEAFRKAGTSLEPFMEAVSEIATTILTALQPVFESLIPVIRELAPIIGAVGQIFGALFKAVAPILSAMLPILRALFPIIKFAAIMLTYLGQAFTASAIIILKIAQGIATAVGSIIKGVFGALSKIPFIGGVFKPLANFGQDIIDMGTAFGDSAADFADAFKALGIAREEIKGIELLEPKAADAAVSVDALGSSAANAAGALDSFAAANNQPPRGMSGAAPIADTTMSTQPAPISIDTVNITTSGDGEETYAAFYAVVQEKSRSAGSAARSIAQALPAPAPSA